MQAGELADRLGMVLLQAEMAAQEIAVEGCYVGDLLSNVMGNAKRGQLWLTVMTNVNVVAVAQLLELAGIVLVEGNRPTEDMLARAVTEGIPVFTMQAPAYEAAIQVHASGLAGPALA